MAAKRLVVCSDGTWSRRDERGDGPAETNVARLFECLAARGPDGVHQEGFYDPGVGVDGNFLQRAWAGVTGAGLERNVLDCYAFLARTHRPGDAIYLFGYSRGAYTVRSAAGMVRKCGLLQDASPAALRMAYRFYRGPDHPDSAVARAFREQFARPQAEAAPPRRARRHADSYRVPIRFLGVWDTVGSLGIPLGALRWVARRRHAFHDVRLSSSVEVARQALAIDERRSDFRPALWETRPVPGQSVEQAWFPGTHAGVGGGGHPPGLPDAAFDWMRREAEAAGLAFDGAALARRVRPDPKGPLRPNGWAWSLRPSAWRPIDEPTHRPQSISAAAHARLDDPACGYAPENLLRHLGRPVPARRRLRLGSFLRRSPA